MNRKISSIVNILFVFSFSAIFHSLETSLEKKPIEIKDRILRTAKIANEPPVVVKGDYGQGTPADQHLYTTRGSIDPTLVNSEKKL